MQYAGEDLLYGLPVYRYETQYEGVRIDQTENLTFLPGVGVDRGVVLEPALTLWVEPVTGRLISYKDDTVASFYDLATGEVLHPWNHFTNVLGENAVRANAEHATFKKAVAHLLNEYIPGALLLVALYLLLVSFGISQRIQSIVTTQRLLFAVGLVTLGVAGASFVGWIIGSDTLVRIIPTANAMNPLTAACFMALGASIIAYATRFRMVAVSIAVAVVSIGALRLIGIYTGTSFSIDLFLFRDAITAYEFSARMAEYTALSFVLVGLIIIARHVKVLRVLHIGELASMIVFVFSLLALTTFLFGALPQFSIPTFFFAAVHTTLLFASITAGLYVALYAGDTSTPTSFWGWATISSILFGVVCITIAVASLLSLLFQRSAEAAFVQQTSRIVSAIEARVGVYTSVLEGAQGLLAASNSVERDEWRSYVESLHIQDSYPGIQGIGYSVFVSPEEKIAHEEAVQAEGYPEYHIRPEGERAIYTAIIYLEPFDIRNQQAFGYDMFSNDIRRNAMERARDTGKPHMSGRITLVQEIDDDVQPGFLIYIPFYANGERVDSLETRREHIVGYSYAPFRARDFVQGIIGADGIPDIAMRIVDGTTDSDKQVLFDDGARFSEHAATFTEVATVFVAGRPWTITFSAKQGFGNTTFAQYAVLITIVVGIIIGVLLAILFYTSVSARQEAERYAKVLTKDLRARTIELEGAQKTLEEKLSETERLNKLMVGRELKMATLKERLRSADKV